MFTNLLQISMILVKIEILGPYRNFFFCKSVCRDCTDVITGVMLEKCFMGDLKCEGE